MHVQHQRERNVLTWERFLGHRRQLRQTRAKNRRKSMDSHVSRSRFNLECFIRLQQCLKRPDFSAALWSEEHSWPFEALSLQSRIRSFQQIRKQVLANAMDGRVRKGNEKND